MTHVFINQQDIHDYTVYWSKQNTCGRCRLGPCMCIGISGPKNLIIPPPNDDHIWTKTAAEVIASTYSFVKACHENVEAGKKRQRDGLKENGQPIPTRLKVIPWTKADDDEWLKRE